jgi:pilus assembly protein FimV
MKTSIFTSIGVMGALGLLAALPAHALGLGKIELSSALNEPFKAEIPVNAVSGDEAESLQVRLASNDEFERAGLVKNAAVIQLKFQVTEKAGKTVIVVSSKNPVKEPLLDFLLLAKTSNGQLIREYTVLLDPPKHVFKESRRTTKIVSSPSISQPRQVISQSRPASTKDNAQYNAPSLAGTDRYGKTTRTDTLWDIALKTRPSRDVSVHQMMLALVKQNKNAFIKQNINGLKSGYTLAIPSANEIAQLTKQQAVTTVQQQNVDWKNRNNVQPVPATSNAIAETTQEPSPALSDVEETLTNVAVPEGEGEPVARLQLLGANDDNPLSENDLAAFGSEKVKALSDQLTIAQEVIESQQQENIDIKSRMAAMEEQIQTLRKLIALQDPDLAKLQSKLEQEAAEAEAALETLATEDLAEATANETEDGVEQVDTEVAVLAEGDSVTDEVNAEENITETAEAEVTEEAVETAVQDEPVAMSWFEKIQAFLVAYKLQALVGVLGLLLGLFFMGRKRAEEEEKVPWGEAVDNIRASKPEVTPVAVAVPAAMVVEEVEPEPEPEPEKTIDDLIKDADVYVGYGDFEKAGIVLEEAHQDEPANMAVIQKLLFTYYKQAKTDDFVTLAEQYNVDRDSMEWAEVAEWGRALDADNILFIEPSIEEPVVDLADLEAGLTFDIDNSDADVAETIEEAVAETENDLLDFNVELSEPTSSLDEIEETVDDVADVNIDVTTDIEDLSLSSEREDSLEIDGLESITDGELEAATQALTDENELAFDLSDFDQIDEAETKLDLATAYIEMGDPEGAKSILQEIMAEGNDEQQSRAQTLLNDLS